MHASAVVIVVLLISCASADPSCFATHALQKIRPEQAPPLRGPLQLSAAQNEYESFQVVCAALGGAPFNVTSASVACPSGVESLVHGVRYYTAVNRSDCDGLGGRQPDALVPAVDPFVNEPRNVFPVVVGATESRLLWIDLFIGKGVEPGSYSVNVTLDIAGGEAVSPLTLALTLDVWAFALPDTSPFATHFLVDEVSKS